MNHITLTPSKMYRILALHDVPPSSRFTATAGHHYGYVAAWTLVDGYHLIQYRNKNGAINYDITEDVSDLAAWLESSDLSVIEAIVERANIRGIHAEKEVAADAEGPFYILVTRYRYGNRYGYGNKRTESTRLVVDYGNDPRQFDTYQSARDWIKEMRADAYAMSHIECAIPSCRIVTG